MRVQNQVLTHGSFVLSTMRGAVGLALCLLVFSSSAFGQSVWNGNTGFWNNAGNWIGGVPTSSGLALMDDGNTAVASSVTVNTANAQAYGLFLDSGDALTLTGFPDTQSNLTVNSASLSGTLNIGGGASFTVNGTADQLGGTVNLNTVPVGAGLAPAIGQINGSGTYDNQAGVITGAGLISTTLINEGTATITATGNLFLNGTVTSYGTLQATNGGNLIINGNFNSGAEFYAAQGGTVTINGNAMGPFPVTNISVEDGGTLVVGGNVPEGGVFVDKSGVVIMKGGQLFGATETAIPVGGLLMNNGVIEGAGQIGNITGAPDSLIAANTPSGTLSVNNLGGASTLEALNGGTLALSGIISAILVQADVGGTVSAENAAIDSPTVTNSGTFSVLGSVDITGDYSQIDGATLNMLLGSFPSNLSVAGDASFDAGSVFDVNFGFGFDPTAGCTKVYGVCESWDALDALNNPIFGLGNLTFDLPKLPDGLVWEEIESANNITLDIDGVLPTTTGGGGGGGSGTTTPEPGTLLLLTGGLAGLGCLARRNDWRASGPQEFRRAADEAVATLEKPEFSVHLAREADASGHTDSSHSLHGCAEPKWALRRAEVDAIEALVDAQRGGEAARTASKVAESGYAAILLHLGDA